MTNTPSCTVDLFAATWEKDKLEHNQSSDICFIHVTVQLFFVQETCYVLPAKVNKQQQVSVRLEDNFAAPYPS